jgi:hypothetical protein
MRQAQRDLRLEDAETYLVDAILPEAGFGEPELRGGWRDPEGVFSRLYPEIITLNCLTTRAGKGFFRKNHIRIDFLHIDANHSFDAALNDFQTFFPLLSESGVVTFHDTNTADVQRVLAQIVRHNPGLQCINLPHLGAGLALVGKNGFVPF